MTGMLGKASFKSASPPNSAVLTEKFSQDPLLTSNSDTELHFRLRGLRERTGKHDLEQFDKSVKITKLLHPQQSASYSVPVEYDR